MNRLGHIKQWEQGGNELRSEVRRGAPFSGRTRYFGRERGQAMIEFALILPVLLVLTLGIIEFGRAAYYDIEVSDAAKAGAQYGAQSMADAVDTGNITQAADNAAQDIATAGLNVTIGSPLACGCPGVAPGACPATGCYAIVYLTVNTSYTYNTIFTYPGIPSSFNLTATTTIPVQTQ